MRNKNIIYLLILTFIILFSSSCSNGVDEKALEPATSEPKNDVQNANTTSSIETTVQTSTAKPEPVVRELSLSFVGDILPHIPMLKYADSGDGFDFEPYFDYVKDSVSEVDYAVCNLETTLSGKEMGLNYGHTYKGYSGYPTFNTPESIVNALKSAGFDMCLNANNHSLDGGIKGIFNTIDVLENEGMDHTGTRKNKADKNYFIKEINGINVAFINYTYAMNGLLPSEENDYAINHLNNYDEARINDMIKAASEMLEEGADINIACTHMGVEYGLYPDEYTQTRIYDRLLEAGIDVIIGNHSHTLQPFELRNFNGENKLIFYSMGNFLSNQMFYYLERPTDFGGIANIKFEKIDDQKAVLKEFSFTPTYCLRTDKDYFMVPIYDLPKDGLINDYDLGRIDFFESSVMPRITSMMKEKAIIDGEKMLWKIK